MHSNFNEILWKQFGAAIDMLENAIQSCDEETWYANDTFWYPAYHTLFYLDYYLSAEPDTFAPPSPFGFSEFDPKGILPERVYTKPELLQYVAYNRNKLAHVVLGFDDEYATKRFKNDYRDYSLLEMQFYNLRHVQHHVGQLNLLLRQSIDDAPKWVSQTHHMMNK